MVPPTIPQPPDFWECGHERSEIRRKIDAAGRPFHPRQCLNCGRPASQSLPTSQVPTACGPWDMALETAFNIEGRRRANEWRLLNNAPAWRVRTDWYRSEYLKSPEWRHRRALVMRRSGRICEGCLSAPATEVHHTTYEHVGREMLWELRAVCRQCHESISNPANDDGSRGVA